MKESYITIEDQSKIESVVQKSRFIAYAFPVTSEEAITDLLEKIRKEHHAARHVCYAFRIGRYPNLVERSNDDGEPTRTAGFPVLQYLQTKEITDTLVVIVRYFGGIKLGTGGLIRAYQEAGILALDDAKIVTVYPEYKWEQVVPYSLLDTVLHHLGDVPSLKVMETSYDAQVTLKLAVHYSSFEQARQFFAQYLQCSPGEIAPNFPNDTI